MSTRSGTATILIITELASRRERELNLIVFITEGTTTYELLKEMKR